jgi:peptidoglycan/xylan/chitin deacetylase (PgdA/CDA1 family)
MAARAIRAATGFYPCLYRPPYGEVTKDEIDDAREIGFSVIGWSVDPRDWARPGVDAIYNIVVSQTDPGAIILNHDGTEPGVKSPGNRLETVDALPRFIDTLRSEGYTFVTVPQLLGYRLKYKK